MAAVTEKAKRARSTEHTEKEINFSIFLCGNSEENVKFANYNSVNSVPPCEVFYG